MNKHLLSTLIITGLSISSVSTTNAYWGSQYQIQNTSQLSIGERIRLKIAERKAARNQTKTTATRSVKPAYKGYQAPSRSQRYSFSNYQQSAQQSVTATIRSSRQQSYSTIDTKVMPALEIGFRNPRNLGSDFVAAEQIETIQFRLTDNLRNMTDFSEVSLEITGEESLQENLEFSKEGYLKLNFKNFRLASGESKQLSFKLKFNNPERVSFKNYSLQLAVDGISAKNKSVRMIGNQISSAIKIYPSTSGNIGSSALSGISSSTVEGGALAGGGKALLLVLNLSASYDDFQLQSLSVDNVYGNNADSLVSKLWLIDGHTGEQLGQTRFINGTANFNHLRAIIARNKTKKFGFVAELQSIIPDGLSERRLKLNLTGSDLELWGMGSGKQLPTSNTYLSLNSEIFTVSENGEKGGLSTANNQPSIVSNGALNQVYKFNLTNAGSKMMALGRVSFDVSISGMEFVGGASLDDFELVLLNSYGNKVSYDSFNASALSGSKIIFDALNQVLVEPQQVRTFALKLKLDNLSGDDKSDSVAIKILGDTSFEKGDLATLRASGKNFIWSDFSGRPHTLNSADWLSAYQFNGLPSSNYVKYK